MHHSWWDTRTIKWKYDFSIQRHVSCHSPLFAACGSVSSFDLRQLDPAFGPGGSSSSGGKMGFRGLGSFSNPLLLQFFKLRGSANVYFSNGSDTSNISYTPSVHFKGECHSRTYQVSLEGSTITFDVQDQINLTVTFVHTSCPDCLLMRFDDESKTTVRFWLFSRRRVLETKELEEFKAQVDCLSFLPPTMLDPNMQLCGELDIRT